MKRLMRGVLVVLVLLTAAAGTASSQTSPKVTPIDKKPSAERNKALETVKDADAPPTGDELCCRGGTGLRFNVVEGRTTSSGEQTMYMTVDFKHAAQPAGLVGRNLQPGQCAFADRTLRTDEPEQIIQEIVSFGQLKEKLHGSAVDTSPTAAERFPDAKNVPQYLSDAKHYWSFFVRQNGPLPSGRFEASYGRYWKPGLDVVRPVDSKRPDNTSLLTPKTGSKGAGVVVKDKVGSSPEALAPKLVNDGSGFQLICRGGPGLRVSLKRVPVTGSIGGSGLRTDWLIAFNHSTQPPDHSGRNLQPGQCSPAEFPLPGLAPAQLQTQINGDGSLPGTDLYPWEKSLEAVVNLDASARLAKFREYLKDPQNYWSFFVKDSGEGDFMADYSQYWKPEFYKGPQVRPFDERKKKNDYPNVIPKKP